MTSTDSPASCAPTSITSGESPSSTINLPSSRKANASSRRPPPSASIGYSRENACLYCILAPRLWPDQPQQIVQARQIVAQELRQTAARLHQKIALLTHRAGTRRVFECRRDQFFGGHFGRLQHQPEKVELLRKVIDRFVVADIHRVQAHGRAR